jgi:hypothetical protein
MYTSQRTGNKNNYITFISRVKFSHSHKNYYFTKVCILLDDYCSKVYGNSVQQQPAITLGRTNALYNVRFYLSKKCKGLSYWLQEVAMLWMKNAFRSLYQTGRNPVHNLTCRVHQTDAHTTHSK